MNEPIYTAAEKQALEFGAILFDHQLRMKFFHDHLAATGEECSACKFISENPELKEILERLDAMTPPDSPMRSTPMGS